MFKTFCVSLLCLVSLSLSAKEVAQRSDLLGKTFINKDASCRAIVDLKENWFVDCKQLRHKHRGATQFSGTGFKLQTIDYGLSDLYQVLEFNGKTTPPIQAYVVKDESAKISLALVYGPIADGNAEILTEK